MTPARPASLTSPTRSIDHHVLLVRTENTFTDRATLTEELEQLLLSTTNIITLKISVQ